MDCFLLISFVGLTQGWAIRLGLRGVIWALALTLALDPGLGRWLCHFADGLGPCPDWFRALERSGKRKRQLANVPRRPI